MGKDIVLEAVNVSRTYEGRVPVMALRNCSVAFERGEFAAIIGKSGSGKSTLLRILGTLDVPDEGTVKIGGADIYGGGMKLSDKQLSEFRRRNIGFVYQDYNLFPEYTAYENIVFPVHLDKRREDKEEVIEIMEKLGIEHCRDKFPFEMSGGEKQRLNIARVMLKNAPILILDEATAFADPDNETKVQAAFANMSRGKTVLMIAHRLSTVTDTSRIFVIKNGQVEESGNHKDLAASNGLYHRMWKDYCTNVGTFGPESAVRLHSDRGNLPYSNANPRQIPFLDMQRMDSNDIPNGCLVESR